MNKIWRLLGVGWMAGGCVGLILVTGCGPSAKRAEPSVNLFSQEPLVSVPAGSSTQVFEPMAPGRTGIDFVHRWTPRDPFEANLLRTGFTGGGVALGDYDGDGRCDVYLTRPFGGGRLYRNLGDFRFEDATKAAGVEDGEFWGTGAVFADLDGDGLLDLVVCGYRWANRVYLNRGKGRFEEAGERVGLSFAGASVKMVFADYDLDGDLDAFLVTNRLEPREPPKIRYLGSPGNYSVAEEHKELVSVINLPSGEQKFAKAGQYDRLYRNELKESGSLRFTDVSLPAGIVGADHGLDAAWWDHNGDGYPDLYVANDFTDPDRFYENAGDGTFREISGAVLPNTPWFTMGCASGDFNNDGMFDLVATDMSGTTHFRQKVAMGSMDAVAWFLDTAEPRQYMRNALFLNTGAGRFMEVGQMAGLANSDWTWSVKVGDLDCDGEEDVFISNGFTRDYLDSDFNEGLRQRGLEQTPSAWLDAPRLEERNMAFRNLGHLKFSNEAATWGLDAQSISFGAAMGDLDGDGDLDLVVSNFEGVPDVYRNQAARSGRLKIRLLGRSGNTFGIGAVVRVEMGGERRVRRLDPGRGYMSADEPLLYFGLGNREAVDRLTVEWPGGKWQAFENVRAGQFLRIREPAGESRKPGRLKLASLFTRQTGVIDYLQQESEFDDFKRQPLLPNRHSKLGPGMAWGDVDGDGDDDLFVGGAAGFGGGLFLNQSSGNWERVAMPVLEEDGSSEDMGCVWLDADLDGDNDLYVVSGGVEGEPGEPVFRDRLYLNEGLIGGKPTFVKAVEALPDVRDSGGPVAAADFDRDGDLDLFVGGRVVPGAYPVSPVSRLLRNDGGRFADVTEAVGPGLLQAGMVAAAIWSDADGDGWSDLLLAVDYGPIRYFRNEEGKLVERSDVAGTAGLLGWWSGIAGGDVDNDGDMDYVVSNLGLNTKYHPTDSKPQLIFYGAFDDAAAKRVVEAKVGATGLLPVRGKSCSTAAMPFLGEKFQTFHAFASASLAEIYTESRLNDALRLEVNRAETGILINDGAGRFAFRPLPRLAQVAPVFGTQFIYVDDDAVPDLFLAQNFNSPQRETGRMNGGMSLVLTGSGGGEFEPVWPAASGVVIPGDAKSVAAVDVDGDGREDLVVGVNSGRMETLLRSGGRQSERFTVRLQGRRGNLAAVGAQMELTRASGLKQLTEVIAGGGYLTQWPARVSFGAIGPDAPVSLHVRWPDGTSTRRVVQRGETVVLLDQGAE